MKLIKTSSLAKPFQIASIVLVFNGLIYGQSLESKLTQKATFIPNNQSGLERLIAVAQYYQIPMGIEWADRSEAGVLALHRKDISVRGLINTILKGHAGYQARIENGVLHVFKLTIGASPQNFLNLRISEFEVKNANVFDAEASLRLKIDMTLHPERYAGGWNGGYGSPHINGFDIENITFSGRNLRIREILNKIVAANGNALWVVRLNPSKMMANDRFFAQDEGEQFGGFRWRFIPLRSDKRT